MLIRPIETQRLLIRPFQSEDWHDVVEYVSDPGVMAYIPGGPLNEAQAGEFMARNAGEQAEEFAVSLKAERKLIGHIVFHPWFAPRTYEIGWVFNKAYQGKGYATEAALAMLKYGFEVLGIHRLIATCQPENTPSYRVMEKLGMRREGHFQQCIYRGNNHWWDEYFYAMLEEEWFNALSSTEP
jgi:[ribosomal protein S5]-alanine N-acetyltransferase